MNEKRPMEGNNFEADEHTSADDQVPGPVENQDDHSIIQSDEDEASEYEYEGDESDESGETGTTSKQENRFKAGQLLSFVRVRFPGNAKSFPFYIGKRRFQYGQKVMAMSDRGMSVGYINSIPYDLSFDNSMLPIRSIAKLATEEDLVQQKKNYTKEKEAEQRCKRYIEQFNLEMNITHVEFIHFGKKAVFYFTAPSRIDFRELVKSLVGELKMRIELRQISVRDRAAALGAVGSCGLQTCCSSFLKSYGHVSIKMAKNQNLALIPSKLNGACGQIKCCIKYEDDVYSDKRKKLPKEGQLLKALNRDIGKVTKLHVLQEQFEMMTSEGKIRRYAINQYDEAQSVPPEGFEFPQEFTHIVNETSEVVGQVKAAEVEEEPFFFKRPQDEIDLGEAEQDQDDDEELDGDEEAASDNDQVEVTTGQTERRAEQQHDQRRPQRDQGREVQRNHDRNQGRNQDRNQNQNRDRQRDPRRDQRRDGSPNNQQRNQQRDGQRDQQRDPQKEQPRQARPEGQPEGNRSEGRSDQRRDGNRNRNRNRRRNRKPDGGGQNSGAQGQSRPNPGPKSE